MLLPTRLKGLLIGNGWISPREQYTAYLTYLERRGFLRKGTQAHRNVLAATEKCNATLAAMDARGAGGKGMVLVPDCEAILSVMGAATMKDGKCLNSYDTREYFTCGTPWPHELTEVTKYLHVRRSVPFSPLPLSPLFRPSRSFLASHQLTLSLVLLAATRRHRRAPRHDGPA